MKGERIFSFAGLAVFAAFIWLRDRHWLTSAADTLPILCALPLFGWLGGPWRWRSTPGPVPLWLPVAAALCAFLGVGLDLTWPLALSWCGFLWAALARSAETFPRRLLVLPLLAFPWLEQDLPSLGWYFRYSGAAAAAGFFRLLGFSVERAGTLLSVRGMALSVDPACAGLNVLQAMLIAGLILIYLRVPSPGRFAVGLLLLAPLAWLANVARIVALGLSGLSLGAEFAMGWFHQWGGWLVLVLMFFLCRGLLCCLAPAPKTS